MFINYDSNTDKLSINSYRKPAGYANDDIGGLVDDVIAGRCGNCPLEGAKDALEDSNYWHGGHARHEVLDQLHTLVCEHEADQSA